MSKKIYFGTNLKMYKTAQMTIDYLQELERLTKDLNRQDIQLFVIPSYTSLDRASKAIDQNMIKLGAQNVGWEDEGQFTGEISPIMLEELEINLAMIGHSERRQVFQETDEEENKKVKKVLEHGFTALLCVGETLQDKKNNVSDEILKMQLKIGLRNLTKSESENVWIAYEPTWAIGTNGIPATSDYAEERHRKIKETLIGIFGPEGGKIPVLYGGSVNSENAVELIHQSSIDGLFIGRYAWHAKDFNKLIRKIISL